MSNLTEFYLEQFPALHLPGWQDSAVHKSYGGNWWVNPIDAEAADITAGLCLRVGNGWSRISLKVRHKYQGFASVDIGDGNTKPDRITTAVAEQLPILVADVQRQYSEWCEGIGKLYPTAHIRTDLPKESQ